MMQTQSRLRELQDLLKALVERPRPGSLVIGCTEFEIVYLVYVLEQLDAQSPADRFFVVPDPFTTVHAYIVTLEARVQETIYSDSSDTSLRAVEITPRRDDRVCPSASSRLRALLDRLLADLPPGDHRLVFALVPARIDDP